MVVKTLKIQVDGNEQEFFASRHGDGRALTRNTEYMVKSDEMQTIWRRNTCSYKYYSKMSDADALKVVEFMKFVKAPIWTTV